MAAHANTIARAWLSLRGAGGCAAAAGMARMPRRVERFARQLGDAAERPITPADSIGISTNFWFGARPAP
jgi:hypothetical protein